MLSRRRALGLAVAGIALGTGLLSGWPTLRWRIWERALEDQLHGLRGARPVPPDLVVVAIDDATLQQGAWFERSPAIPAWARGRCRSRGDQCGVRGAEQRRSGR